MPNITESPSHYDHLETFSVEDCLFAINEQDATLAACVNATIPQQTQLIEVMLPRLQGEGRLFYVGAGTSGRLGVLDAAECPPTFGVSPDKVIGLMAGGEKALSTAVEFAEDNAEQAVLDLKKQDLNHNDVVIGISASGGAAYVLSAIQYAKDVGALTGCITCNPETQLATFCHHPIICIVGPEFVTGSTRMKAGTVTKLILNMISTTLMIQLGHVKGNQMIDMQLNNVKLEKRAVNMIVGRLGCSASEAREKLSKLGSVRAVIEGENEGEGEYRSSN